MKFKGSFLNSGFCNLKTNLVFNENKCNSCGYSKEPWSSFEHQKCMFKLMDKKTIKVLPSKSLLICAYDYKCSYEIIMLYYILINDTKFELSFFWPSDTESRINELRFSEFVSLSFKTRLTSVTCF